MIRKYWKKALASVLILFMCLTTGMSQQVDAMALYKVVRNINIHWVQADGTVLKEETIPHTAQVSDASMEVAFPPVPVQNLFTGNIEDWQPNMDTIPAATGSYSKQPAAVDLYMVHKNNQPVQPEQPQEPQEPQPEETVDYQDVTINRTVYFNYYNKNGQLIEQKKETYSTTATLGYKVSANGQKELVSPVEYTFEEIQVPARQGYVASTNVVPAQKVNIGVDADIEYVVEFKEENKQPAIQEGWYRILCAGNQNYSLDVNGNTKRNNENIQIYKKNNSAAQKFYIKDAGDGYYYILTGTTNGASALDVSGAGRHNGANIIQYSFHGGDNQKWSIKQHEDGSVSFVSKHSGLALDFVGARYQNFTNVASWSYHGGYAQKFVLVR